MSVFGAYASFYDALYADKDYARECDFIEQVWATHATAPVRTVLDLGCGTGGHAFPLVQRGYAVTGVDRSVEMLAVARHKRDGQRVPLVLHEADICDLALAQVYDAVISMFAVMSYQCESTDLLAAFRAAARHLAPGGLFLFDVWFGPAVLHDPPIDRYKIIEQDGERIVRFAHPEMALLRQVVTVHYRVWRLRGARLLDETVEQHPMRFCFPQELVYLLAQAGFDVLDLCPFARLGVPADEHAWTISVVARRRPGDD